MRAIRSQKVCRMVRSTYAAEIRRHKTIRKQLGDCHLVKLARGVVFGIDHDLAGEVIYPDACPSVTRILSSLISPTAAYLGATTTEPVRSMNPNLFPSRIG